MNVLVIGGNGFIGSHLIDVLILNGHKVRVYDLFNERYRPPLKMVDYRISSLDNIPDLHEALLEIDIVFHLASASVPSTSNVDMVSGINNNIIPTLNLLNLMLELNIKRFVYFSSGGAIYGNPKYLPLDEDHPLNPISSYGVEKLTIEKYLMLYQQMYGLKPLILRPSNPYGPRQGHYVAQGVISTFLRKVQMNESITVFGNGNAEKDYIFISDLVRIVYELSMENESGIYNIGSGIGTSLNKIIEEIKKETKKTININYIDKKSYDVDQFVLDNSKTMNVIEYKPLISIEVGISNTWDWLNESKSNN